jgi:hypothetical protein
VFLPIVIFVKPNFLHIPNEVTIIPLTIDINNAFSELFIILKAITKPPIIIIIPFIINSVDMKNDFSLIDIINAIIDNVTDIPPKIIPLVTVSNGRNPSALKFFNATSAP